MKYERHDIALEVKHTVVDTVSDRDIFRPSFQEQLQEIDTELARFDTDEGRLKELGDGLLTTTIRQPSLSGDDKGTGTMFTVGRQGV
nr:hypothetical protein CFP56_26980 [Quercus suber]